MKILYFFHRNLELILGSILFVSLCWAIHEDLELSWHYSVLVCTIAFGAAVIIIVKVFTPFFKWVDRGNAKIESWIKKKLGVLQ